MKISARAQVLLIFGHVCLCLPHGEAAEDARALRLGHFPNLTHAQALYARATGTFEKAIGVPIKWTTFNAGPSAIEALFTRSFAV